MKVFNQVKKTCLSHPGVFDFGHTGSSITESLGKFNSKDSVTSNLYSYGDLTGLVADRTGK